MADPNHGTREGSGSPFDDRPLPRLSHRVLVEFAVVALDGHDAFRQVRDALGFEAESRIGTALEFYRFPLSDSACERAERDSQACLDAGDDAAAVRVWERFGRGDYDAVTGQPPGPGGETMPDLPAKMVVRVERIEYAEIEVDTAGLIAEWGDVEKPETMDEDDVIELLHQIGVVDLMYGGDFIKVLDKDNEESIRGR